MTDTHLTRLSEREQEILRLIATGASNKEIALQLVISANTVRVHLRNIFEKINVDSRTEAALYAVHHGLVESAIGASQPKEEVVGENVTETSVSMQVVEAEQVVEKELLPQTKPPTRYMTYWLVGFVVIIFLVVVLNFKTIQQLLSSAATPTPTNSTEPIWIDLTSMQTARKGLVGVALEDHIYAIAGESSSGVTGINESYNIATNTWETLSSKPTPVSDVSGAVVGGLIFIPGGRTSTGNLTATLEVYNPANDTWEQRSSMPVGLSGYALESFEGKLYLFGGYDGVSFSSGVYIYDPALDEWKHGTSMLESRAYASAVTSSSRIFVIGGKNENGAMSNCEYYHPARENGQNNPWSRCSNIPKPMYGMGAAGVANIVVLIGGLDGSDTPISYQFAPQTGSWQQVDLNQYSNWGSPKLIPLGSHLFMVGGEIDGSITAKASYYKMLYTIVIPIFK